MRARYTVRLFGSTAHVLRGEDRTACGKAAPLWWLRYVVRPPGTRPCRKCGAGP